LLVAVKDFFVLLNCDKEWTDKTMEDVKEALHKLPLTEKVTVEPSHYKTPRGRQGGQPRTGGQAVD
jgi:hypothetical protein